MPRDEFPGEAEIRLPIHVPVKDFQVELRQVAGPDELGAVMFGDGNGLVLQGVSDDVAKTRVALDAAPGTTGFPNT